ncbi:MAG: DUF2235 domain-containing protein [Rhodobacteraceae bacterium]|nr:DUF2235 domain-containing protein [Paracoccaceae bacterium]
MKRIAIFCDGTWNGADQPFPTNVRRLALMIPPKGTDGVPQLSLYFQGVGVPEDGTWLERLDERISGGAMGIGLDKKIAIAYEHLGRHYEPGDEVHVFGFSRGAYTARSLIGLIRSCGLPRRPPAEVVEECFARYRDRSGELKPDAPSSMEFRLRVSPQITTSPTEEAWRRAMGHPAGHPFRVAYLGIWDTVGALGIPSYWGLPARLLNRKYRFHDTALSRSVASARHAVALDERRRPFVPTLWTNLDELRAGPEAGDYRQEWFAGVHGAVGGGGDIVTLSGIALIWIAEGARAAGLTVSSEALGEVRRGCDASGELYNSSEGRSLIERIMGIGGRWRDGPTEIGAVAHPAVSRWRLPKERFPRSWSGKAYRPKTLAGVAQGLDSFDLAALHDYSAFRTV